MCLFGIDVLRASSRCQSRTMRCLFACASHTESAISFQMHLSTLKCLRQHSSEKKMNIALMCKHTYHVPCMSAFFRAKFKNSTYALSVPARYWSCLSLTMFTIAFRPNTPLRYTSCSSEKKLKIATMHQRTCCNMLHVCRRQR